MKEEQPTTEDLTNDYRDKITEQLNTIQDTAFLKRLYYLTLAYKNRVGN